MVFMKRNIFILLAVFLLGVWGLLCMTPTAANAYEYNDYWSIEDYLRQFPEQAFLMDRFSSYVRSDAVALDYKKVRPLEILVVYPGLQVSDYWRRNVEAFEKRLKETGIRYNLTFHLTKPGESGFVTQSKLIEYTRTVRPDFLVFTLDAMRHKGFVNRILGQGDIKIILQNITTPVRSFGLRQPFLYVGFDHVTGTRMIADEYIRRFPEGGRFAIFYPEQGYISKMRGDVFLQEMAGQKNMEMVESYYMAFDAEQAYIAAKDLLNRHDDIDFIYATSTDIAHGIVRALKETGRLEDIVVNGWGGGETELEAIQAGEIDFTVMRMNDDSAVAMAEAIRLYLSARIYEIPAIFSGDFRLVDRKTPQAQLTKWKDYAFRYSN